MGCRSMLISESGGGGGGGAGAAAGAGISAFLAMGQVNAHASEIEAGLSLEAEAQDLDGAYNNTPSTRLLQWEMVWTRPVDDADLDALPLYAVSPTARCSCQHRPETSMGISTGARLACLRTVET